MNRKRPAEPRESHAEAAQSNPLALRHSEVPGVYLNAFNIPCDEFGVALTFKQVKERDDARFIDVLGEEADTPAKLLKAVAMDPRQATATRVDAAKAAAPYFDRKQPIAIDGGAGADGQPVPLFDPSKLKGLSDKELTALRELLAKAGAPTV